jgi:biofilm PGA synthesis N-glycosyltransferase PgaC
MANNLKISVGICAYNEATNIKNILEALQSQKMKTGKITEIIVVSSGSTDGTIEIIESMQKKNPIIKLIKEPERKGKSSAVNLYLESARGDICVIESADTIPLNDTLEKLCLAFLDPAVGIAGAHSIPVNSDKYFVGFAVQFIWRLHHKVSLFTPKLGELIAFRNVVKPTWEIQTAADSFAAADETFIEGIIRAKGYRVIYVPEAYVKNKGPETLKEYMEQRKRNHLSHLYIKQKTGYQASTMNSIKLIKPLMGAVSPTPRSILWTGAVVLLEIWSRLAANYDFYIKKTSPCIWKPLKTTKTLVDGAR